MIKLRPQGDLKRTPKGLLEGPLKKDPGGVRFRKVKKKKRHRAVKPREPSQERRAKRRGTKRGWEPKEAENDAARIRTEKSVLRKKTKGTLRADLGEPKPGD
jgi:hypothetical protein